MDFHPLCPGSNPQIAVIKVYKMISRLVYMHVYIYLYMYKIVAIKIITIVSAVYENRALAKLTLRPSCGLGDPLELSH